MQRDFRGLNFDWITIALFLLLVGFGWLNIMSASHTGEIVSYFDMNHPYGKQSVFIIFTFVLIILILALDAKFYERFTSVIYFLSIVSLLGLFLFGKNVNGALGWYGIGGMTLQPSEFAKFATSLAVAKYISDLQTNMKTFKDQVKAAGIIVLPAIIIVLQNDTGSALVYVAFFFVFYREGLQQIYLVVAVFLVLLAVLALKFNVVVAVLVAGLLIFGHHFFGQKKRPQIIQPIAILLVCMAVSFGIKYFYNNILQFHQKDRISLWLRLENDPQKLHELKQTILYNLHESEKAISSGGLTGKGFMQGTRTTGKFVPEQHTDYIFSTVGEEWGFLGSALVVLLFVALLLRILYLAELQKSQFSRVYGYCVASILFFHFLINIGMVMGLIPTIGIPLPFFSYGGSALWAFTILLFIFVKLDSNRINEW
ncbi:rod shape-determining protein RodA [Gelidibacter pelagius]|uniref:Cell wall polymerase n=1 Tax=Gelidibacter pelagius TaxID=2819985 RepID=A0ABS3SV32_9FLAO|nr:rod shape-determining protein RodA [Gelidibacter pelagius]MBO3099555.1 rod shape-determining protein RodA [Gelidibacter pelagius]